ncbi:unnamed protein product [Brassica oleracea]
MSRVVGSHCMIWMIISVHVILLVLAQDGDQFECYLHLDGMANTNDGPMHLTNNTVISTGHAMLKTPINFTASSPSSFTFSTEFVFAIFPLQKPPSYGQGMSFVVAPKIDLRANGTETSGLGLFNSENNNKTENHILAVELDTNQSPEAHDESDNHVGIDINSIVSVAYANASYYSKGKIKPLLLASGDRILVWIDYDGVEKLLNVTLAQASLDPQDQPEATNTSLHGVSRRVEKHKALTFQRLWMPLIKTQGLNPTLILVTTIPTVFFLIILGGVLYLLYKKKKYAEVVEQWEKEYSPQRYSFRNLYKATKGFRESQLLGAGGFGKVYKGILPPGTQIAVKKVYHNAEQGMKQYVAEIASMGRLRHKNLVQLLGYCRRKGELLLVYDYMPNGSLDDYLFNKDKVEDKLKHLTCGNKLYYIEISKASNILLDAGFNGRLGDFGFARFHDHGQNLEATRVVGTIGYMAPELTAMGVTTTCTDVYAFGSFILEVVCGRRPVDPERPLEQMILLKWVASCGSRDNLMVTVDSKLEGNFKAEEVKMLLKLGMLCSQSNPENRPSMRHIVQYLEGNVPVPSISFDTAGFGMPNISNETVTQMTTTSTSANFSFEDVTILFGGR